MNRTFSANLFLALLATTIPFEQSIAQRPPGPQNSDEIQNDNQLEPFGSRNLNLLKEQKQPTIDEWKSGKFSPEPYMVKPSDDDETRLKKQRINVALMEQSHFEALRKYGGGALDATLNVNKDYSRPNLIFIPSRKR